MSKKFRILHAENHCDHCGCPFMPGDTARDLTGTGGPLACSKQCENRLQDDETDRQTDRNGRHCLSCFV